jgi:Protein of unknown function (DUF1573)
MEVYFYVKNRNIDKLVIYSVTSISDAITPQWQKNPMQQNQTSKVTLLINTTGVQDYQKLDKFDRLILFEKKHN